MHSELEKGILKSCKKEESLGIGEIISVLVLVFAVIMSTAKINSLYEDNELLTYEIKKQRKLNEMSIEFTAGLIKELHNKVPESKWLIKKYTEKWEKD